jgi:hypothetical protein
MVYRVPTNWLLITAVSCNSGDRLVDLRDKIPRGLHSIDLMVTVEPFYARSTFTSRAFRRASSIAAATSVLQSSRCPWSTAAFASDKVSRR